MNKESVGKLFKGNFGIYECVAYSDRPSVVMKNTITNESICVSIDSNYAKTFELIEEDKKIRKITLLGKEIKLGSVSNWLKDSTNNEEKIASCIECNAMKINEIIDYIMEDKHD